jgi:hypothetical protein
MDTLDRLFLDCSVSQMKQKLDRIGTWLRN